MLETCPACKQQVLFVRETLYDGFEKVGDVRRCSACGHEVRDGKAPEPGKAEDPFAALFSKDELPDAPRVFSGDENARFCRYCSHYVVNPFRQRCMLHERDVDATDSCPEFEKAN